MAYVNDPEPYDRTLRDKTAEAFEELLARAQHDASDVQAWTELKNSFHKSNHAKDRFHWESEGLGKAYQESQNRVRALEDKDRESELKMDYMRCMIKSQSQEIAELKKIIQNKNDNSLAERLAQIELAITSVMGHLSDVRTAVDTGVAQQTLEVERQQKFRDDWYQHRRLTD